MFTRGTSSSSAWCWWASVQRNPLGTGWGVVMRPTQTDWQICLVTPLKKKKTSTQQPRLLCLVEVKTVALYILAMFFAPAFCESNLFVTHQKMGNVQDEDSSHCLGYSKTEQESFTSSEKCWNQGWFQKRLKMLDILSLLMLASHLRGQSSRWSAILATLLSATCCLYECCPYKLRLICQRLGAERHR